MYEWVDVCLLFLTNSYVVSPGSNDGTHMCGNDGNDPPKKVQELETQNRVSEETWRMFSPMVVECEHLQAPTGQCWDLRWNQVDNVKNVCG